jgi:caffeoyl-CoA O-methyltransferase
LEVGTFTGYSALSVGLALPDRGTLDALDISEEYMAHARGYWDKAGVSAKIRSHVGPALQTLDRFLKEGRQGSYDFAFIDADKGGYDAYYERALLLLKAGGVIAIDNVLWSGEVANQANQTPDTRAIRALNAKIAKDERVDIALATIADGLFLVRKR